MSELHERRAGMKEMAEALDKLNDRLVGLEDYKKQIDMLIRVIKILGTGVVAIVAGSVWLFHEIERMLLR